MNGNNRSSAIAAAIIILGVGIMLFVLPKIVLWVGDFSPVLATVLGSLVILSFFLIFWLRARYQRRRDNQN
ncbi:MAG TPA: hypothetical protein DIC56_17140 [Rhizobium sp.]|nr:hypothetical protein [Rhizobium sp.]